MRIVVVAEHESGKLRRGTLSALGFARELVAAPGVGAPGDPSFLVLGDATGPVSGEAARYAPVLEVSSPNLAVPVADRHAEVIADIVQGEGFDTVVAASGTFARDVVARAAGRLGGSMASEVTGHEMRDGELHLERPMFAGSITATVRLLGTPRVVTVRPTAYERASPLESPAEIRRVTVESATRAGWTEVEGVESKATRRPDLTEARVVVSGGRAFRSPEAFEGHVGALADALGGAAGCSRALVDAGIAPNELQVGQTGKIVAPELYIALGLSGAVQHLAGMKNSRVIVAVNKDPDAPIFEVSDYGLVGDVYQVVPELLEKLKRSDSVGS